MIHFEKQTQQKNFKFFNLLLTDSLSKFHPIDIVKTNIHITRWPQSFFKLIHN
jgi:hypothetical protein